MDKSFSENPEGDFSTAALIESNKAEIEKTMNGFDLENKMRDAVKNLVEPFLQRETYLCNEVELMKIKVEKHESKIIGFEALTDKVRYLERMNTSVQNKFQIIDGTMFQQNEKNNTKFEDQLLLNTKQTDKTKALENLVAELAEKIDNRRKDHDAVSKKLIMMRSNLNEDIVKSNIETRKLIDQMKLRVDLLSNDKDSLSFHLNNQKSVLSEINSQSERVRQEMLHYKSLLDPIISSAMTKNDFEKKTSDIRMDMKYLVDQMTRFHRNIDKINSEHKEKLQDGLFDSLHEKLLIEISNKFVQAKADAQRTQEEQFEQAAKMIQSNADEHKKELNKLKDIIQKEIEAHIEKSMDYARRNFMFDSEDEDGLASQKISQDRGRLKRMALKKESDFDKQSQSALSAFSSESDEEEIKSSVKVMDSEKHDKSEISTVRMHPTPVRYGGKPENPSLSHNESLKSHTCNSYENRKTSHDFVIKSTLANCVAQISTLNSKISQIMEKHRKTRLIVSKIARKIECDDRLSKKIEKFPEELKSVVASESATPCGSSPRELPPKQEVAPTEGVITDMMAQLSASIAQSEENCISIATKYTDKMKILMEELQMNIDELKLDFDHWKKSKYKDRKEVRILMEKMKEELIEKLGRKSTVDVSLSPFSKSIVDAQDVREIFVHNARSQERSLGAFGTSSICTGEDKNLKTVTARGNLFEAIKKGLPNKSIKEPILTLRKYKLRSTVRNANSQERSQVSDMIKLKRAPAFQQKLKPHEWMNKTFAPKTVIGFSTEKNSSRNEHF
ncbi:unnamed protein product [Moneuplotes crassus]|uniref:Uncharacterized protein n=1 Tax=Euplotes crassus TaxID=5936 RepID=A0AAD2D938_EUPCR|nr:unnamed protein product [Moneuplotes crassus]